jgi:HD-GYP domain-containing protein (c-di-GMP phosphodiesterase class II)/DNA-binding CsgD family transcriptional regulator
MEAGPQAVPRLAELLGALSLTTDLGSGVPFEKGLRTCVLASGLAEALELSRDDGRAVYFAALLRSLGCTAHAPAFADWFEDDVFIQRELKVLDLDDGTWPGQLAARFASWSGPERAQALTDRFLAVLPANGADLAHGSCEVSAMLGADAGLPDGAIRALDEVYERYDGRGFPSGRAGDELTVAARVVHVAERAVMAHYDGGPQAALDGVRRLAGGQLDPQMCTGFAMHGEQLLAALDSDDILAAAVAREPAPRMVVSAGEIDRVCAAFATFADLKGRLLLGHSMHVATLAERAAGLSGWDADACRDVRLAGLLLDLGRVGVSSAVWDRPGRLAQVERERVRLHSYWTERILERCSVLSRYAPAARAHHERLDGSGYHRGSRAPELSPSARLIAAADVFAALTEERPHRPALVPADAARTIGEEVSAGRLDGRAVAAVVEAAGLPPGRAAWPNDLTDREVEVLRVLVRGLTNRQIADQLVVSPRTVQHHLASIYNKIDLRTRAGAAVFAIEHGLVPAATSG